MYIFLFGLELRGYSMPDIYIYIHIWYCMSERIFNDGFVFKNGSDGSNKGHFLLGRWRINPRFFLELYVQTNLDEMMKGHGFALFCHCLAMKVCRHGIHPQVSPISMQRCSLYSLTIKYGNGQFPMIFPAFSSSQLIDFFGGFPHGFSYDFPKMFPFKPSGNMIFLRFPMIFLRFPNHDFPMISQKKNR